MSQHPYVHVVRHAFKHAKEMPSVGKGKSPVAAFVAGVLFGPFGIGLYLRSWGDFLVLLGLLLAGSFMTVGVAAPVFWVLCGVWGAVRVQQANAKPSAVLPA